MAYCVHCGVKLGAGEKRCPLCQTPVYDPTEPEKPAAPKPYPVRTPEQELKRSKRFLLTLSALMLLAPAGLCFVIDPIDGTTNFIHHMGASAVSVALFEDGAPLALMLSGAFAYTPGEEEWFSVYHRWRNEHVRFKHSAGF